MTAWVWLAILCSLALFVFLAISGKETPNRQSIVVSLAANLLSLIVSVIGLIGVIRSGPQLYLLSVTGVGNHTGFNAGYTSCIAAVVLFAVLSGVEAVEMLSSKGTQRLTATNWRGRLLARSWWSFSTAMILLTPTYLQAMIGAWLMGLMLLVAVWRLRSNDSSEGRLLAVVLVVIGVYLQTRLTWVVWTALHTLQIPIIAQLGVNGSGWEAPASLVWLWAVGVVLQFLAIFPWRMRFVRKDGRFLATLPEFQMRLGKDWTSSAHEARRISAFLFCNNAAYVWVAWSVIVGRRWMLALVVVTGVIAIAPVIMRQWALRGESVEK